MHRIVRVRRVSRVIKIVRMINTFCATLFIPLINCFSTASKIATNFFLSILKCNGDAIVTMIGVVDGGGVV